MAAEILGIRTDLVNTRMLSRPVSVDVKVLSRIFAEVFDRRFSRTRGSLLQWQLTQI